MNRERTVDALSPAAMLAKYQLAPSKDRGQNFLDDPNVIRKVVDAVGAGADDTVIEIGPGFGALTFGLAERAGRVVAVELDAGIVRAFNEEFGDVPGVTLVHGDALEYDLGAARAEAGGRKLIVAGNVPYSVTSPLIARLVQARDDVSRAVIMVQAEVGDRLVAEPGSSDYGRLSVVVQFHACVRRLFAIRRTCFTPRPQVDSRVIEIDLSNAPGRSVDGAAFEAVVTAAFGKRRKMLRGALAELLAERGVDPDAVERASGIDLSRRGETLTVEEFAALADTIGGGRAG